MSDAKLQQMQPLGDRVLIQIAKSEEVSKGGIIIPEKAQKRNTFGIVIGKGEAVQRPIEIGDEVFFDKYGGQDIKAASLDSEEKTKFILIGEESIWMKVNKE